MKIYYVGPYDSVEVVATENVVCVKGEPCEVPDEIAKSLLAGADWSETKSKATRSGKGASE